MWGASTGGFSSRFCFCNIILPLPILSPATPTDDQAYRQLRLGHHRGRRLAARPPGVLGQHRHLWGLPRGRSCLPCGTGLATHPRGGLPLCHRHSQPGAGATGASHVTAWCNSARGAELVTVLHTGSWGFRCCASLCVTPCGGLGPQVSHNIMCNYISHWGYDLGASLGVTFTSQALLFYLGSVFSPPPPPLTYLPPCRRASSCLRG